MTLRADWTAGDTPGATFFNELIAAVNALTTGKATEDDLTVGALLLGGGIAGFQELDLENGEIVYSNAIGKTVALPAGADNQFLFIDTAGSLGLYQPDLTWSFTLDSGDSASSFAMSDDYAFIGTSPGNKIRVYFLDGTYISEFTAMRDDGVNIQAYPPNSLYWYDGMIWGLDSIKGIVTPYTPQGVADHTKAITLGATPTGTLWEKVVREDDLWMGYAAAPASHHVYVWDNGDYANRTELTLPINHQILDICIDNGAPLNGHVWFAQQRTNPLTLLYYAYDIDGTRDSSLDWEPQATHQNGVGMSQRQEVFAAGNSLDKKVYVYLRGAYPQIKWATPGSVVSTETRLARQLGEEG